MKTTILKIGLFILMFIITIFSATATEYYQIDENVIIQYPCYLDGKPCFDAVCDILIINPDKELIINQEMIKEENIFSYNDTFNITGLYNYLIQCEQNEYYGSVSDYFEIGIDSVKGLSFWSCPDTSSGFNILYILLGLSIFLIILSLMINESIIGIIGGLMMLFSYFYIGGCAPLLTSPLLVAGLLITAFFGLSR